MLKLKIALFQLLYWRNILKALSNALLLSKIWLEWQLDLHAEEKSHFVQPLLPSLLELPIKSELQVLVQAKSKW